MAKEWYMARWPIGYHGEEYDRGQLIPELVGSVEEPHNEKLLRLGYIKRFDKAPRTLECGECGALFLEENTRQAHGEKRHRQRGEALEYREEGDGKAVVDTTGDREMARLMQQDPLYLEQTTASRQ